MLKETKYRISSENIGVVKYVLQDNNCVFSSVAKRAMSSINAAEVIINAIAKEEGIDPRGITFYDFLTHLGYSHIPPGKPELMRLTVEYEGTTPVDVHWEDVSLDNGPPALLAFSAQ